MEETLHDFQGSLTEEMWAALDSYIEKLPERVRIVIWASELNSCTEGDAVALGRMLAERYDVLEFRNRPRQPDYPFYPVIGIMGIDERQKDVDYGVRFIGHPAGYQINSLVGAIQAVAFKGMKLEPKTRILISRMPAAAEVKLLLFTTPENESGVLMATLAANLAVTSPHIKTWIAMVNDFPQVALKYSIYNVPHMVINERYHLEGVYEEEVLLRHIARALENKGMPPESRET